MTSDNHKFVTSVSFIYQFFIHYVAFPFLLLCEYTLLSLQEHGRLIIFSCFQNRLLFILSCVTSRVLFVHVSHLFFLLECFVSLNVICFSMSFFSFICLLVCLSRTPHFIIKHLYMDVFLSVLFMLIQCNLCTC